MKMKLLTAIALSGIFIVSNTFASSFIKAADDLGAPSDSIQAPSIDSNPGGTSSSGNVGSLNNAAPSSPTQLSDSSSSNPSSDEMTADAASGEDDF